VNLHVGERSARNGRVIHSEPTDENI
jgi:hypothetical protein